MSMNNHGPSALARAFSALTQLGPLVAVAVYIALGTTGLFAVRGLFRVVSGFLTPKSRTYGAAAVTATLPAFELKPLVVYDAGLEVFPRSNEEKDRRFPGIPQLLPTREEALLEFEYQGHADYVVDLSENSTEISSSVDESSGRRTIRILLPRPCVSGIKVDDASSSNRWLKAWGSDKGWKEYYRNNHEKLIYGAISRTAHDEKVRGMAEKQTKEIIRKFVAPLVEDPDNDIIIDWKD